MDFFTKKQISKEEIKNYYFHFIVYNIKDNTLSIKLNRPEKKNALHPQMINEIGVLLEYAKYSKYVRIIIFESTGDTFCAGLDLKVINSKIDKIKSTVPSPKSEIIITDLLKNSAKPIISKVTGNVYAGGVLLIANSTYVIATVNLKSLLSIGVFSFSLLFPVGFSSFFIKAFVASCSTNFLANFLFFVAWFLKFKSEEFVFLWFFYPLN